MKIKRIELTNFRGIESLTLDFTGPDGEPLDMVVLAGPNGCGKTSVLEACLTACGHLPRLAAGTDVRAGASRVAIEVTISTHRHEETLTEGLEMRPDGTSQGVSGGNRHNCQNAPTEYFSSWREPKLVGSVPVTAGNRNGPQEPVERNRLALIKQHLVNLTARRAMEPQEHSRRADSVPDPFARVNNGWRLFYPDRDQRFAVRPAGSDIDEGFDLFLEDEDSDHDLPVDALSSGEIEILTMLGWFATRDLSDGIVLIDEPELHVHPAWHRTIMRALRVVLPETQIICATHSPEVLESVYSYERFTLLPLDDPRIRLVNGTEHPPGVAA